MNKAPNRRRQALIVTGVAAMAAVAGAAWQSLRAPVRPVGPPWDQRFPTPDGAELDMAAFHGRPLVLNFWATWCPPCIKELPELERFHREWSPKGWRVVGLAVDGVKPVREFLQKQPLSFAVGMAGLEGTALSRQLGNEQGALPFTAVFDRQGRLAQRKLGQTDFQELSAWARGL